MREIKFRGFAVEEMVGNQWMIGSGITSLEFTEDYAEEVGRKGDWYVFTDSGWVQVREDSVGQCTGLKDKKGVGIYEGDVVEYAGKNYLVEWQDYMFNLKGFYESYLDIPYSAFSEELDFEVVGNVYENPHLLEASE